MRRTSIVIPCFNEAARLPRDQFARFIESCPDVDFIFVNDGSDDSTLEVLQGLAERAPDRVRVIDQQPNRGKAEAVRVGMLAAFDAGSEFAGYWDADLATPLAEIANMLGILDEEPDCEVVLGARVQLLGRKISRRPLRHYLGRVFATVASLTLGLAVYDTQCGAKLFRSSEATRRLFAKPFLTNWVFDVEILARLMTDEVWHHGEDGAALATSNRVIELPLQEWIDVAGSKVRYSDFIRCFFEMARLYRHYYSRSARH